MPVQDKTPKTLPGQGAAYKRSKGAQRTAAAAPLVPEFSKGGY